MAGAGDFNGDGLGDIVVGGARSTTQLLFIYQGAIGGIATTPVAALPYPSVFSVANAGDVNGDGYTDVVVGDVSTPAVYVFEGSTSGLRFPPATTLTVSGLTSSDYFGGSVAGGDMNGDGYSDVIVGAADVNTSYVYLGSAGGVVSGTRTSLIAPSGSSEYGTSVAIAGDLNGDTYADAIVGTYGTGAYVYSGGAGGIGTSPISLPVPGGSVRFGGVVANSSDVYTLDPLTTSTLPLVRMLRAAQPFPTPTVALRALPTLRLHHRT